MSSRNFPDWIDSYLEYTKETEPRRSFRLWAAISAIASVLQRKVFVNLGMETFFPNLYIILVGPPAARKGTALRPARLFLNDLGVSIAADESSRQKLVGALLESGGAHTDDEGNTYFHSSMTISASELTVFLGYNNIELLSILCKWFDCEDRFVYDTYAHESQEVPNVWVNLIGCTTPTLIQSSLPQDAMGSGFVSRTIFVYENDKDKLVIWPTADPKMREKLLEDLSEILSLCGHFKFEGDYIEQYGIWRQLSERNPMSDPHLSYYFQRRHVHLLKLSMVLSVSRNNDMILTVDDFERAKIILESAEKKMPYVFMGTGSNPLARVQLQIMKTIAERKAINLATLMRIHHDDISREDLGKILTTLSSMDFCRLDIKTKMITFVKQKEDFLC